jgi:hypothetical protein
MHKVIKLGVFVCILLVITVGITTIFIIQEMTDIADEIAKLFDLGYRNTIVIIMSAMAKELLQFYMDMSFPWQSYETSRLTMYNFCNLLNDNYESTVDDDMSGRYAELNNDPIFPWHEYSQNEFHEVGQVGVKAILSRVT